MKTKWRLYILWSVFSLSIVISTAADVYESPSIPRPVRRKKLSHAGNRKSGLRLTSHNTSPSPHLTSDLARRSAPAGPFSSTRPKKLALVRQERLVPNMKSDYAYPPDVSVTCSTSDLVVRVKTNFYGLGASAAELTLGRTCRSNGILGPYGDLLFTYPLTACDARREMPRGHLVYNYVLHYETSPKRFPTRRNRVDVDIQCRFQRDHHVYRLAVRPTWQTPVVRKKLERRLNAFQIQLMDDLWTMPTKSQTYLPGQTVNFQVSTSSPEGKLYISSCYATPFNGSKLSPTYTIIDNYGCMLESQRNPKTSQFISPRTDKTLRFSLSAFQFTSDPDAEVVIHCKLFVTSEDPSPARKSCTYRENRWRDITGDDSICDCCVSQCLTSKSRRAMVEGFASSGPLLVSDQLLTPEDSFLPVIPPLVSMIEEEDEGVLGFETEMHQLQRIREIKEFPSPETWLDDFDVTKYDGDADEPSPTDSVVEEDGKMEEDEDIDKLSFSPRLIMEERQHSNVRDSELFGEGGSGSLVTGPFLREEEREEGEEGSEGKVERKRSELREAEVKEEGISNERQWVHLQTEEEEPPLGTGVEEMLPSEKEGVSKPVEKWREDTEQPLETHGMEEEEGKGEKSTARAEEAEEAIASEFEWKTDDGVPSDGLVEMSMVDGREMTWHFKWR